MLVNAGHLFHIAEQAYSRLPINGPSEGADSSDALVAIVFSAAALEAFLNESGELALQSTDSPLESVPLALRNVGIAMAQAEDGRGSPQLKYLVGRTILEQQPIDKGQSSYQHLDLLFKIRNEIVHLKPKEKPYHDEQTGLYMHSSNPIVERLRALRILREFPDPNTSAAFLVLIATRRAAQWACLTVAKVVRSFVGVVPQCYYRDSLSCLYRNILDFNEDQSA